MPIHHRIPGIIGQAISKGRGPAISLVNSDKLLLNQAYKGFKHKSSIVGGIRTGLFAGGVIGSFIRESDNPEMDAQIPFFNGSKTSSPYQARRGRGRYSRRYSKCRCRSNKFSRRPKYRNY